VMNGKRWDLAVELLESGESVVALGDCLIAYREVAGPRMTGNIRVEILSTAASESLTLVGATEDIVRGLAQVDLLLSDDRVADIVRQHGLKLDHVKDYDIGRKRLASIAEDWSVTWEAQARPRA